MSRAGMVNGQLAREEYGEENVYLTGFSSYKGTVIAGKEWGATMQIMNVPTARPGSIEDLLHKTKFLLFNTLFVFLSRLSTVFMWISFSFLPTIMVAII